ncbi:MAG: PAS domain S-box protein, partial [Sneathiella sp.]|nr:PAS domain S-box protein [Sneathiella sp.]
MRLENSFQQAGETPCPDDLSYINLAKSITTRFPRVDKNSDEMFKTVVECLPQPIAIISLQRTVVLYTNSFCENQFEDFQTADLSATHLWTCHGSELEQKLEEESEITGFEYSHETGDGLGGFCSVSLCPIEYFGEVCFFLSFHNLTKLHRVKTALMDREAQYRDLIETAPSYIVGFSEQGDIKFVSKGLGELLGFEPQTLIGLQISEFVHPVDLERVFEAIKKGSEGEDITGFPFRCRNSEGGWLLLEASGRDMRDDPIMEGFIVALHDITERQHMSTQLQRNRMELRTIVDASLSSISLIDREGFIRRANKTFEKKWNIPLREVIGKNAKEFVSLDEFNMTIKAMEEARLTREKTHLVYLQNDRWYETYVSPVIEGESAPSAFV